MRSVSQTGFRERPLKLIQTKLSQFQISQSVIRKTNIQPIISFDQTQINDSHFEIQPPDSILDQRYWGNNFPSKVPVLKQERVWLLQLILQLSDQKNLSVGVVMQLMFELNRHLYSAHKIPFSDRSANPFFDLITSNERLISYLLHQCEENELGCYFDNLETVGDGKKLQEQNKELLSQIEQLKLQIAQQSQQVSNSQKLCTQMELEMQRIRKFKDERFSQIVDLENTIKNLKQENAILQRKIPKNQQKDVPQLLRKDPYAPVVNLSLSSIGSKFNPRAKSASPLVPVREAIASYTEITTNAVANQDMLQLNETYGGSFLNEDRAVVGKFDLELESKFDIIQTNVDLNVNQLGKEPQPISGYSKMESAVALRDQPNIGQHILENIVETPIHNLNVVTKRNDVDIIDIESVEYNQLNREVVQKKKSLLMTANVDEDNILNAGQRIVDFIANVTEDSAYIHEKAVLGAFMKEIPQNVSNLTNICNDDIQKVDIVTSYLNNLVEEQAFSKIKLQFNSHDLTLNSIINPYFKGDLQNDDFEVTFQEGQNVSLVFNQPKFIQRHNSIVGSILRTSFIGSGYSKSAVDNFELDKDNQLTETVKLFLKEQNKNNLIFNLQSDNIFNAGSQISSKVNPFEMYLPNLNTEWVLGEVVAAQQDEIRIANSQIERIQSSKQGKLKDKKETKLDIPVSDLVQQYVKHGGKEIPSILWVYDFYVNSYIANKGQKYSCFGMKLKPQSQLSKLITNLTEQQFHDQWNSKDFRGALSDRIEKPFDKFYKRIAETLSGKNKDAIIIPEQFHYTERIVQNQYFIQHVSKNDFYLFEFEKLLNIIDELIVRRSHVMKIGSSQMTNNRVYTEFGKFVYNVVLEEFDYDVVKTEKYLISIYFSTSFYSAMLEMNNEATRNSWLQYDYDSKEIIFKQSFLSCSNYIFLLFLNMLNDNLQNSDVEFVVQVYYQMNLESKYCKQLRYTLCDIECAFAIFNKVFKLENAPNFVNLVLNEGLKDIQSIAIKIGDINLIDIGRFIHMMMRVREQLNRLLLVKIIKDAGVQESKLSFEQYLRILLVQKPLIKIDQQPYVDLIKVIYNTALVQFNNTSANFLLQQTDMLVSSEIYNTLCCNYYGIFIQNFPILQLNQLFYGQQKQMQCVEQHELMFINQNIAIISRLSQLLISEGYGLSPFGEQFMVLEKGSDFSVIGSRFGHLDARLRFVGENDRSQVMAGRQMAALVQQQTQLVDMEGIRLLVSYFISGIGRLKLFNLAGGKLIELGLYAQIISVVDHFMAKNITYKSSMESVIGVRFDDSILDSINEFLLHFKNRISLLTQ